MGPGHPGRAARRAGRQRGATLAEKLARKLPEAMRYTKTQLNWWRDLVWSQTVHHARDWLAVHSTPTRPGRRSTPSTRSAPHASPSCGDWRPATGGPVRRVARPGCRRRTFCGACGTALPSAWEDA